MSISMRMDILKLQLYNIHPFYLSWAWTLRTFPILFGMLFIDLIMTHRIIFKRPVFKANGHKTIFVQEGQLSNAHISNAEVEELHLYRMVDAHIKKGTIKLSIIYDALIQDMDGGKHFDERKD